MRKVTSPTARVVIGMLATLLSASFLAGPATAVGPPAPGDFTGYGFDACVAPSQTVMDAWNLNSPYSAVGIYISGNSRYCGDAYQPHLSPAWVQTNADRGWRFLPIHVGYQAPCFKNNPNSRVQKKLMSRTISTARSQAVSDAKEFAAAARAYGFNRSSVLYLDIEWYPRTDTGCDNAVRQFIDAFNKQVYAEGFYPGLYSSGSAAIKSIDALYSNPPSGYTFPHHMWFAWTNNIANVDGGPYLSWTGWKSHKRIHQYLNGVNQTYGGHTINLDKDFIDTGRGSVPTTESKPCGVTMSFSSYPKLAPGTTNATVKAAQCLLRGLGYTVPINGVNDAATVKAINAWRGSKGWAKDGKIQRREWVVLLSGGSRPRVLKYGSVHEAVWRLQRALVANGHAIKINGLYGSSTVSAVQALRTANGLSNVTTTEARVWGLLATGAWG